MSREILVGYWHEKAWQDIASAADNLSARRLSNTVRDAYFACFHAFFAVLMRDGKAFRKHKEARSALHRDYVHEKKIEVCWESTGCSTIDRKWSPAEPCGPVSLQIKYP